MVRFSVHLGPATAIAIAYTVNGFISRASELTLADLDTAYRYI